jgi:EAL domain-containing protein (putative c-di-GMP-specific phosphodiesterase class I)
VCGNFTGNSDEKLSMDQNPQIDAFRLARQSMSGTGDAGQSGTESNARLRFAVAQAIAQNRMDFHFQPVVSSAHPTRPAFYEMLARMRMPGGKLLPAGAFVPVIQRTELGRAIDRLALRRALQALARTPSLRLSINLSPETMGDEEWLSVLNAAARGNANVCGRLILEISENAAIEHAAQTVEFMNYVRALGPAFALDDFGAGATGFRHFARFRFDLVKIDGIFARGIHADPDSQVLFDCLLRLSRHFEMFSVAEGVECEKDAAWLCNAGVDCMQGYLFGRPAPVAQMPGSRRADGRAAG